MEPASDNPNDANLPSRLLTDPGLRVMLGAAAAVLMLLFAVDNYLTASTKLWPLALVAAAIVGATIALTVRRRPRHGKSVEDTTIAPPGHFAPTSGDDGASPTAPVTQPPPLADSGVAEFHRPVDATDWFNLRQVVRQALNGADPLDANRLTFRIDAALPETVQGNAETLSGLLRAFAAVTRNETACCLYFDAVATNNGRVVVGLEIRRKNAGPAKASTASLAAAEALMEDLGGRLNPHPEIGTLVLDGQFEFKTAQETGRPIQYPGRALFIVPDETWESLGTRIDLPQGDRSVAVSTFDAAAREIALAIRLGKPYAVVLTTCDRVFQPQAVEAAREFGRKCAVANIPFYLLGEPRPNREFLHDIGYANWLAKLDGPTLRRAMETAAAVSVDRSENVVPVAPWLWGKGRERRRVLVVDDTRTTRLIVCDILKASGYDVDAVDNAEAALPHLTRGDLSLAIIDLHMPGTDGITLLQRYHQTGPAERVPILVLTANTTKVATQECAAAGADAYLTKPIHGENLLAVVRTLIAEEDLRRYGERGIPATDSPESLPLVESGAFRGITVFVPAAEVIRQFAAEAADLLAQLERGLQNRRFDTCTDHARSLRTCALAVGASALAGAAERMEKLESEQLERMGMTAIPDLRSVLAATIEAMTREAR